MEQAVADLWQLVQQTGPFGAALMFYMWMRTDAERRKLIEERNALHERTLTGLHNATDAVKDLSELLTPGGRKHG